MFILTSDSADGDPARQDGQNYLWPLQMEASMPGVLRTILILVAIWWILRMLMKSNNAKRSGRNTHSTTERPLDQRPKGEVRVENVKPDKDRSTTNGTITDADFEEIN